jgi:hypothetical protein
MRKQRSTGAPTARILNLKRTARIILRGIEVMHMIRKEQMKGGKNLSPAEQFYSLAA